MSKPKNLFWHFATTKMTVNKAFKVALIVGVILNLINQGDNFISLNFNEINWSKFILTFFVPYGVSSYSAAMANISFTVGDNVAQDSIMKCTKCGNKVNYNSGSLIKECNKCNSSNFKLIELK